MQFAYDDRAVVVVNSTLVPRSGLKATARVLDLASRELFARTVPVDVGPDASVELFAVPEPAGAAPTYFLSLALDDAAGRPVSRNVYWLSTQPDVLAWDRSEWYVTPVSGYADLTGLDRLPPAQLRATASFEEGRALVRLENTGKTLAFFVHMAVRSGPDGEEVLPVLWEDNDVTLLPGEVREIAARYAARDTGGARPVVAVEGWNVARATIP